MKSVLFWDVTQRGVVIPCRRCETTYLSHLQGPIMQRREVRPYRCFGTNYRPHFQVLTLEDGTDSLSRKVGKELLPLYAV